MQAIMARNSNAVQLCLILTGLCRIQAADLPHFRAENGVEQLVVQGKPFLILGGELGNSSAGTAAQGDRGQSRADERSRLPWGACVIVLMNSAGRPLRRSTAGDHRCR